MSRLWKDSEEVNAFRPQLVEMLKKSSWAPGNPRYDTVQETLKTTALEAEQAYGLIRGGRFSSGQAALKRVQLKESRVKEGRVENEIALLDVLDGLGIDREYKNNDLSDPTPKLLFHFRMEASTPGLPAIVTLDLTAETFQL